VSWMVGHFSLFGAHLLEWFNARPALEPHHFI
jgi:hypothetical protein